MNQFATPSARHEPVPKEKRHCTTCRRDVAVSVTEPPATTCPACHEPTLLPPNDERRHSGNA